MRSTFAQSIRRSLVFSSSSSLGYLTSPFDSFFAACARDFVWDSSSNSFQHNAIRIYCFRIVFSRFESIRVKSKLRSNREILEDPRNADEDALENASFREICLFTGLIYGERILLEPRGRRRGRRKGWGGGR